MTDLPSEYKKGFDDGCSHMQEDYKAGERLDLRAAQARIKELEAALLRIASASDYYGKEASDHDELALAYAHQSTNRLARAALKGDANED